MPRKLRKCSGRKIRRLIERKWYRFLFPAICTLAVLRCGSNVRKAVVQTDRINDSFVPQCVSSSVVQRMSGPRMSSLSMKLERLGSVHFSKTLGAESPLA